MKLKLAGAFAFLLLSSQAKAFLFDANVFYFTDTFAPATGSLVYAYTNYDVRLGFGVDKKQRFFIGWNYSGVSAGNQVTAGTNQYISTEMGPSFLLVLNKDKTWILSFTYNISSNATYTPAGGTAEKWKGTTMKAYLGYNVEISEGLFMGPTINYYAATFSETIVDDTTYSTTGNARSQIYPALYLGYRY